MKNWQRAADRSSRVLNSIQRWRRPVAAVAVLGFLIILWLLGTYTTDFMFYPVLIVPLVVLALVFRYGTVLLITGLTAGYLLYQASATMRTSPHIYIAISVFTLVFLFGVTLVGWLKLGHQALRDKEKRMQSLLNLTHEMSQVDDSREFAQRTADALQTMWEFDGVTQVDIVTVDDAGLFVRHTMPVGGEVPGTRELDWGEGLVGQAIKRGKLMNVPDVGTDRHYIQVNPRTRSQIAIPMFNDGHVIGALSLENKRFNGFDSSDEALLKVVAEEVATFYTRVVLTEQLREQATRDTLTGLYNHGYFKNRLDEEVNRARRYGRTVSVIMVDLDDFKQVNDRYGHLMGDRVLKELGRCLVEGVREPDVVCRYGGEEFAVILPETMSSQALVTAQRLLEHIRAMRVETDEGEAIMTSASIGVACFPQDAADWTGLIAASDRALYLAKNAGKNQVRTPVPRDKAAQ